MKLRNGWWIGAVLVSVLRCLVMGMVCPGAETTPERHFSASAVTDIKSIDARPLEWTWANGVVTTGPVLSWNREQPNHLWGGGIFGMLTVTPDGNLPVRNLFPWVGEWLQLPETLPVQIGLGVDLKMVNVAHDPSPAAAEFIEITAGPMVFQPFIQQVEGGSLGDLASSGVGLKIGVRPIRF